ncbi:hypothetical protein Tco_0633901 [Tanacetum coccineum]
MQTCSAEQDPTTPYSEPERFIHQTLRKKKKRNPFIPIEDQVPKAKYPPFENLFEAEVVYNPFLDLPFPMANDQPMWGNNRAVAPTPGAAIIVVDLEDNIIEDLRRKKQIMPPEDIEEIVMVEILELARSSITLPRTRIENHLAAIQDLETKFGRISDHQSSRPISTLPSNAQTNPKPSTSNDKPYRPPPAQNEHVNVVFTCNGKTYDPPVNPNAKPAVFLDDSEDEADEVKKETEPLPKKPTYADPPPLKAYKPKISYP